ncbi:hypothetical protein ACH5RR_004784 [Cinchona calisaya]|uniref:Uncharacterized protein n=1 Tax=Cinchona calisaya TaxID=153742 RepID=A0ABD3AYY1_9GENT
MGCWTLMTFISFVPKHTSLFVGGLALFSFFLFVIYFMLLLTLLYLVSVSVYMILTNNELDFFGATISTENSSCWDEKKFSNLLMGDWSTSRDPAFCISRC